MTRTDIINALIERYDYQHYLEIGLGNLQNFNLIQAEFRQGVDVKQYEFHGENDHFWQGTSDEYFDHTMNAFDLIFIDGDHSLAVSARDMLRSFTILNPGGRIVVHDVLPLTPEQALPEKPSPNAVWCGEVWRNWVEFRRIKNVQSYCVDCDHGCGVMMRGVNTEPLTGKGPPTVFDYIFSPPRSKWKNSISPEAFLLKMQQPVSQ